MRRSARNLLVPAATAAASAAAIAAFIAVPAAATSAGASGAAKPAATETITATPSPTHTYDSREYAWGPYYARHFKAKAEGKVRVITNLDKKTNRVLVTGKLYDLDYRTYAKGGKCAYVQFKIHHSKTPHWKWYYGPSYKWCGADKGVKHLAFWKHNVDGVQVRVSQVGKYGHHLVNKGHWHSIHSAA